MGDHTQIRKSYDKLWRQETSDSPDSSQHLITSDVISWMKINTAGTIADLGSGPSNLSKMLRVRMLSIPELRAKEKAFHIVSVDFASISSDKRRIHRRLLPFVHSPIQADMKNLPIPDSKVDLAVSNHAVDFVGEDAFKEVARILRPGGQFVMNLHHPNLWLESNLERVAPEVLSVWRGLAANRMIYDSPETITEVLSRYNLTVLKVDLIERINLIEKETYWRVAGVRE